MPGKGARGKGNAKPKGARKASRPSGTPKKATRKKAASDKTVSPRSTAARIAKLVSELVDGPALLYEREPSGTYALTGHARRPRGKARELARVKGPEARPLRGWQWVSVTRDRRRVGLLAYRPGARGKGKAVSKAKVRALLKDALADVSRGRETPARPQGEPSPEPGELLALVGAGRALAANLRIEDLMQRLAEEVHELTHVSGVYVALADREAGRIRFPLFLEGGKIVERSPRPMRQGLTERVLETGKPLLIARDFEGALGDLKLERPTVTARSWLAVPIRVGKEVAGVLGIFDTDREGVVGERHVAILSVLAGHLGVGLQNAHLFRRLAESEARYRAVAEAAEDAGVGLGILSTDREESPRLVFVNPVLAGILGVDEAEATSRPILTFVDEADQARLRGLQRAWLKGDYALRAFDAKILRPDGSRVPIEVSLGPTTVGEELQAVMFVRDLTDRVRAEEELRGQKDRYEQLLRAQSDLGEGILVTRGARVEYANDAYCRMTGYTLEELRTLPSLWNLIPPDDREGHADRLRRRLAGEKVPDHYESRILCRDGRHLEVEVALKLLEADGEPHFITIVRDVTERRRSEALYQSVVETASRAKEGVAILQDAPGDRGRFVYVNEEFARMTGYTPRELVDTSFPRLLAPETAARVQEIYEARSRGEEEVPVTYEAVLMRRDGERVPVEISAGITSVAGVQTHVAFVKDITERKAAEAKLLQLKNLLQEIVENVPAGVLYLDAQGVIVFENRYLLRFMGAGESDAPRGWFQRIFDLPTVREHSEFVDKLHDLLRGEAFHDLEFRYRSLYGKDVTIIVSGVPLLDKGQEEGAPVSKGGILLIRDATEEHQLRRQLEDYARDLELKVEERTQALSDANAALARVNLNLETIYNATIDGFLLVDKDRNFVSVNQRFCEIFGYESPEAVLSGDPEEIRRIGKARMKDPGYFDATYSLYAPEKHHLTYDGEVELTGPVPRRIHEHSEPIFDEKGEYLGRAWTYRDVTEQRLLQEALSERGQLLTTILENTTEGVFALDPDGDYLFCNRRHSELMGFGEESVVHQPLFAGFEERRVAAYEEVLRPALEGRHTVATEVPFVNRDGRDLHLLWHVQPLLVDGRLVQVVGTVTDLTERQRLEEELIQYTRTLEDEVEKRTQHLIEAEKMAALGQLVAGVAHEINNPLAYVKSNTATLQEVMGEILSQPDVVAVLQGDLDRSRAAVQWLAESGTVDFILNQQGPLFEMNLKGLNRIGDIVQRLKSIASPQPMKKTPTDFNGFLRDTAHIFHAQFKNRIELVEDYEASLPPVHCDGGMVSQVAMNLLVNAAQAIPEKGTIRFATRREGRYAVFEVEDDGAGMTPEVRARIFDPFFTTKDKGNTGLGLPISFKIIKEHGGDVSVKSTPGAGTTFTVRIPIEERT